MTHVELLYFDDCPHHEPLLARVRALLGRHEPTATVEPVLVTSDDQAQARRFLGSPTLRVNGGDVEPGADERTDFGLKCRLYHSRTRLAGAPEDAWIVTALQRAGALR